MQALSNLGNWFNKQITSIETAHAEISWEEALDTAIYDINAIKDIESESGQKKLKNIFLQLQKAQKNNK